MGENVKSGKLRRWGKGILTFVGVGGVIAIIKFGIDENDRREEAERNEQQRYQSELRVYRENLTKWEKWRPSVLSSKRGKLSSAYSIDLDNGRVHTNWRLSGMDLSYQGGGGGSRYVELLRSHSGAQWYERGVVDPDDIKYRELRGAGFAAEKASSGYPDMFNGHPSNSPGGGYIFFVKTSEGNLSIFNISEYETENIGNGYYTRKMVYSYVTFPNRPHPPKPIAPRRN
jgi:hypothetical protein